MADPLRIEVKGNAGLLPFVDRLLPFRGIPAVQLSYVGERFYVPGLNPFFLDKQTFAQVLYLLSLIIFFIVAARFLLRLAGKQIGLKDIEK